MGEHSAPGETPENPLPVETKAVEPKVKVQAIVTYVVGLLLVAVVSAVQDGNLLAELPDPVTALLAPVLPVVAAFAAAYRARHQYRAASPLGYPTE